MAGWQNKLYNKLPVFLQNLAVSMYGYQWQKRRFGGIFEEELRGFKERENFSFEQWTGYQEELLRKLLLHAIETVPYYREKYTEADFSSGSFKSFKIDDLQRLPFLEKNELRKYGTSTLVSTKPEPKGEFFASSGSTGTPTEILFSYPMHQRWSAGFEARIRDWAGVDRFTARGMIGGRRVVPEGNAKPPFYRYNFIEKQVYFSAYHISPANVPDYLEAIKKYRLQYMTGYAVSNYLLAKFFYDAGVEVPRLKAVITSSEKLTSEMREIFRKVYGCKTYDSWSGVEACGLISECEHGSLHISPDLGIIEVLDEQGKPCPPGVRGEVVCTGLVNFDQPLIRYRIGDSISLSDRTCECGRNMPVVEEIFGRIEDVVVGPDGREMVRFHGLFIGIPKILESQVIQHDYADFTIKVAVQEPLSQDEINLIRKRLHSQLGEVNVVIEQVDNIPRGPNGKFKAVISHIKRKNKSA